MGKRYYFPNQVIEFEGHTVEVTGYGTVYERDERGSMRRVDAIWLPTRNRFQVELLNGTEIFLTVVDGKFIPSLVHEKSPEEAPGSE